MENKEIFRFFRIIKLIEMKMVMHNSLTYLVKLEESQSDQANSQDEV